MQVRSGLPCYPEPCLQHRPRHIAIIMDGNGRWAEQRGERRLEGHRQGAVVVRKITTFACQQQVQFLTLYSFSRQNWQRHGEEVAGLMALLEEYCEGELETLMRNDIRLVTVGEVGRLPPSTQQALANVVACTCNNRGMTLCLALDYGGREELVQAVRKLAWDIQAAQLQPEDIDERSIQARLYTSKLPDPDLLIRTSGEMRISNFLLWQLAYAELHFCKVYWPDFTEEHLLVALRDYAGRERRYGRINGHSVHKEVLFEQAALVGDTVNAAS